MRARRLDRELISQAQAKQRMGRAGRTEPGICYHLYTSTEFNDTMLKFPEPEIRKSDITTECLRLLATDTILTVEKLIKVFSNFIEVPKEDYIRSALIDLDNIGAIKNNEITEYGKLLNQIPENNIFLANSLIFGKIYNCSREIMKIGAMINVCKGNLNDLYNIPSHENRDLLNKFNKSRKKFSHKYGDHLTLLTIYDELNKSAKKDRSKLYDWAYKNFFKINTLLKAPADYKKTKGRLHNINIGDLSKYNIKYFDDIIKLDVDDRVLACIIMGFQLNTAIKKNGGYVTQYYKGNNGNKIRINKISVLADKGYKHVVYYELFISNKQMNLSCVSKITDKIMSIINS